MTPEVGSLGSCRDWLDTTPDVDGNFDGGDLDVSQETLVSQDGQNKSKVDRAAIVRPPAFHVRDGIGAMFARPAVTPTPTRARRIAILASACLATLILTVTIYIAVEDVLSTTTTTTSTTSTTTSITTTTSTTTTSSTRASFKLNLDIHHVRVATVETRKPTARFSIPGVHGWSYENLGAGKHWGGYRTKVVLYRNFVHQWALRHPDEILILMDGGDTGFGGCNTSDLLARYAAVVDAGRAQASVVVGGDNYVWPPELNSRGLKFDSFAQDRAAQFDALGFNESSYHPYQRRGRYNYVNSGFMMGPASTLKFVLECMDEHGWLPFNGKYDDQFGLTMCMFYHPDKITIDYSGSVVLDMWGFYPSLLHAREGLVYNKANNNQLCFLHGNGGSFPPWRLMHVLSI